MEMEARAEQLKHAQAIHEQQQQQTTTATPPEAEQQEEVKEERQADVAGVQAEADTRVDEAKSAKSAFGQTQ